MSLFALRWSSTLEIQFFNPRVEFQFALCAEVVFDSKNFTEGLNVKSFQFALCAEVVFDRGVYLRDIRLGFNSLFALRWSSTRR